MFGRQRVFLMGITFGLTLFVETGSAQSPFRNLLSGSQSTEQESTTEAKPLGSRLFKGFPTPFRRVNHEEAEVGYQLQMSDGPWMIMCASFPGEGKHQAEALCKELRSIGFKAYTYEHSFDYSQQLQGLGYSVTRSEGLVDQYDLAPAKMRAANPIRTEDVSVLVGHFSSAEDSQLEKTLTRIKGLYPKSLHVSENSETFQNMVSFRELLRVSTTNRSNNGPASPMKGAFAVPNPLLPEDYFERQVVDPIVIKMNKGDKFSLLNNPKAFTVRVATFKGETLYDEKEIERKNEEFNNLLRTGGGLKESKLMEAEANANYIAELLREKGFEAYSYHDRDSSIVCVGSFDWAVKDADSRNPTVNPAAQEVIDKFKAKVVDNVPGVKPFYEPLTVVGPTGKRVALDLIPVAVAVPRIK